LSRSFTFRGETYVANASLDGDLSLRQFRAMYAYRSGNEKLRFRPMVDMGIITTGLKLSGTTNNGGRSGEGSISKFAATIGYDVDYDPNPKLNLFNNLELSFSRVNICSTWKEGRSITSPTILE